MDKPIRVGFLYKVTRRRWIWTFPDEHILIIPGDLIVVLSSYEIIAEKSPPRMSLIVLCGRRVGNITTYQSDPLPWRVPNFFKEIS